MQPHEKKVNKCRRVTSHDKFYPDGIKIFVNPFLNKERNYLD